MSPAAHPPLLDAGVRVDHIPPDGREIDVVATHEQREAIAARLKISAVDRLEAHLHLTRFRGGLRVTGTLDAATVQPCIITFAPVPQEIHEPVERIFLPDTDRPKPSATHPEVFVDLEAEDPPDYFDGHEVDLSEAIVETLALALDPYPRAEGATIEGLEPEIDAEEESPFASLKSLLDPDGKG